MNLGKFLSFFFVTLAAASSKKHSKKTHSEMVSNNCMSFSVGSGTGCAWMCQYCANNLGTNNYYFTDGVCSYQDGGCVGNPIAGKTYTCCSA